MKALVILAALALTTAASAEDLSKATKGVLLSSDCDADVCHSYTIAVSQRFVRLPIKRQAALVHDFCARLDKGAEDYQEEDGSPWTVQSCIFQYQGADIAYQAQDGHAQFEPGYVMALAALRDAR